jgi:multidrug efflux pump subunit AcrA (membrane-fusion protein)
VKIGMTAMLQVYAFRGRQFNAKVTAIIPAADPETQRYTIILDLENPPENLLAGMTGEMNIITGRRENALLVPTRALLVDQALIVSGGFVRARAVNVGYRTLDFAEVLGGLAEGDPRDPVRSGSLPSRSTRARAAGGCRTAHDETVSAHQVASSCSKCASA